MKINELPTFITTREYANITRANYNVILRKCKDGDIPCIKRNNRYLIPTEIVFDLDLKEDKDICEAARTY